MGISEDGEGGGGPGLDCSVGTIVWVRRRNGSWWPGRILGPDELSASHLMSPRSGTPVKLLGREDASVDWYNLEKSKRVKAFRCGEFDACIERAEASQGIPIKKREKYARREDAILHALELEKKQLESKQQKFGVSSNGMIAKPSGVPKREFGNFFSSENYMRNDEPGVHGKFASHKSQTLSRNVALSHGEENMSNTMYLQKGRNGRQFGWEEDIPESIPRMRGLQDFGLRTASSKRKHSSSVTWENSRRSFDNHVDGLPGSGHVICGASHGASSKGSLGIKRKRSQGGVIEESLVKKRDRRRPLVQVLQSSAKLPISHSFQFDHDPGVVSMHEEKDHMGVICRAKRSRCVYLPADSNDSLDHRGYPSEQVTHPEMDNGLQHTGSLAEEYSSSGLIEADESDSLEGEFSETDTEEDEDNLLGDTTQLMVAGSNACDSSAYQVSEKFRHKDSNEVPLSSYMPHSHPHELTADACADVGVSKWHMKGKRNTRNLVKRPMDVMDGKISFNSFNKCNGSMTGTTYERKGSSFLGGMESSCQRTSEQGLYHNKRELDYGLGEVDMIDKDLVLKQWTGYSNRRYPSVSKAAKDRGRSQISYHDSDNDSHLISPSGWEAEGPSRVAQGSYWEDSDECYDQVYAGHRRDQLRTMLVDVDLKVQASYQGEHVPLVSLMSRLNGKAIIGHPVQIEIVEDGSTHQLVSRNDAMPDESAEPPPVWRTARRTVMQRIPRSNPAKSALEGEDAGTLQYSDRESKPPHKKYSGHFNHQARLAKKSISHARRPVSGKLQKQPSKRVNLSSQKTRTLSSIATEPKRGGETGRTKLARSGDFLGGLIKPEGVVPLVTCVPVKVVFSRILEAVGRPSSAVAHRVRLASPAVRDPL